MTNCVLALERLHKEVSNVAKHSLDEGREDLNMQEIEHLLKMTNDVVSKIKQHARDKKW